MHLQVPSTCGNHSVVSCPVSLHFFVLGMVISFRYFMVHYTFRNSIWRTTQHEPSNLMNPSPQERRAPIVSKIKLEYLSLFAHYLQNHFAMSWFTFITWNRWHQWSSIPITFPAASRHIMKPYLGVCALLLTQRWS